MIEERERWGWIVLALGLVFLGLGGSPVAGQDMPSQNAPGMAVGHILEGIVSEADPAQTYAVFLPPAYTTDRTWPLLLVLDARGRGRLGAELFQPGAEAHGYVILSSDLSRSDDEVEPNLRAVAAMLQDARRHLAVDPERLYIAGFSGTARFAYALGVLKDRGIQGIGRVTGVISASGGLPQGSKASAEIQWHRPDFPLWGTAGQWDFNLNEMIAQDEVAAAAGVPHRLATFEGAHSWPPQALAAEALEWMRLQAMRSGLEPPDEEWMEALWARRRSQARIAEELGDPVLALTRYRDLLLDFPDHPEATEVQKRQKALEELPEIRRRQEIAAQYRAKEEAYRDDVAAATRTLRTSPAPPVERLLHDLRVEELRRIAEEAEHPEERAGARRLLEVLAGQVAFYLPREFFAQDLNAAAAASLEIALAIRPDSAELWYNLACARARQGRAEKALEALQRAYDKGFRNLEHVEEDPDLENLREDPDFERVLAQLRSLKPRPGTSLAPL
jgi:tetratricopeptide (TPR) repeat protein